MTRAEVRAFIKSGVDAVSQVQGFNNGRISEFNSEPGKDYPYVWLESLSVARTNTGTGAPSDDWAISIHVAKKDAAGSSPSQYEAIVDQCDEIAAALSNQYNNALATAVNVVIDSEARDPFIHRHADDLSGVVFSFTLRTWANSSFC